MNPWRQFTQSGIAIVIGVAVALAIVVGVAYVVTGNQMPRSTATVHIK